MTTFLYLFAAIFWLILMQSHLYRFDFQFMESDYLNNLFNKI